VIDDVTAPVPDVATLPTITAECGATLTAPTASDNCAGSITGTTTDPIVYNTQGSFTVTWTYNDGNGNSVSQVQNVVIDDVTAPVPDVATLPTITAECGATLIAPTASDNCAGSITGTTTDPIVYNTQGNFTVTWTYNDGNGNSVSQVQNVVIDDVTNPLISNCPSNIIATATSGSGANVNWTAPTASDNCGNVTLTSTHNPGDLFPIGVTTVTYTADDGNGNTATCSFDIQVENGGTGCGPIPTPWMNGDVGNVGIAGSACYNPSTQEWTIDGSGKRIGGKKDQFHFVWQECDGDMDIIARVTSQSSSHNHAKAGIMIRQSLNKKSKNAAVLVRPNNKTNFQCRVTHNGQTYSSTVNNTPMTHWVRLTRIGNQFTAYESVDGENWNVIGSEHIDMSGTVYIGMAVTSKNNNQLNVATMDNVSVNCGGSTPVCGDLPSGWSNQDVGNVNIAGSACYDAESETYHVKSSGYDIYHKKDKFHYVWQDMCGNGEIIARVEHLTYTSSWALGGIMMRKSLSNKSKNVSMLMRAGGGSVFQVRYQHNKHTYYIPSWASAPKYIKLAKWNNLVCAYVSNDGANWYGVGYTYIGLGQCFKVGLAVTSHNNSALNHTIFSNVEINSYGNGNSIPNLDDMPLADENMPTSDVRAEEFNADVDLNNGSSQPNITTNSDDVSNLDTPTELTINAYPNPFQNHLNLEGFVPNGSGEVTISVMTIDGKVVYQQQNFAQAGNRFNEILQLNTLATGIYLIKIQTETDVKVVKVNKVF
jgi:regulation of enolase protein 1 (concanavalin A-like superfamily)